MNNVLLIYTLSSSSSSSAYPTVNEYRHFYIRLTKALKYQKQKIKVILPRSSASSLHSLSCARLAASNTSRRMHVTEHIVSLRAPDCYMVTAHSHFGTRPAQLAFMTVTPPWHLGTRHIQLGSLHCDTRGSLYAYLFRTSWRLRDNLALSRWL